MPGFSVIVVSDLHAGEGNPFAELRVGPSAATIDSIHRTPKALAQAITEAVSSPAETRVLVCAGDLSDRSHSAELELAGRFLEELAATLQVPREYRFLVPGNHDIDWKLTELGASYDPWYDRLRQRKFEKILSAVAPSFTFCSGGEAKRAALPGNGHLFLLDSPWDDRNTTRPHHGRLGADQITRLKQLLRDAGPDGAKLVLLHHHVTPHGRAKDDPDFSLLLDSGELTEVLMDAGAHFVIHGHQHRFSFQQVGQTPRPLSVLCSGSTASDYVHLPKQVPNAFHVVTFDDASAGSVCGEIQTRIFMLAQGWVRPNRTQHRLSARAPFGHSATQGDVDHWIGELLAACDRDGFIRIDPFIAAQPQGRYYNPDDFLRLLKLHLDAHGLTLRYEIHFHAERDCWQIERA
jgi:predicted phosphodiesterase